jgi:hypothetical protein
MVDKETRKAQHRRNYLRHKEEKKAKALIYYAEHKEQAKVNHHNYYIEHQRELCDGALQYEKDHPEHTKARKHKYNIEHHGEKSIYNKEYRGEHVEEIQEAQKEYYTENKDRLLVEFAKYHMSYSNKNKVTVLTHYGKDGKLACVRCGFDDIRALSIDHINGGGLRHIRSLNCHIYVWLIRNNFPSGFQTLCMNCQWVKRAENGECFRKHHLTNDK